MNGVLFELIEKYNVNGFQMVNLAKLCQDIAVTLKVKILRDVNSNSLKNEIVEILERVSTNEELSKICFDISDYDTTLISNVKMCVKTTYVLNNILFNNIYSTFDGIEDSLIKHKLVSLFGINSLYYIKHCND